MAQRKGSTEVGSERTQPTGYRLQEDPERAVRNPMLPHETPGLPGGAGGFSDVTSVTTTAKNVFDAPEKQPSPLGFLAWTGFGCAVFGLACLCIGFASPFWLQTYPNSFNNFQNLGLWEVCFHNYMHHKDDSQEIYSGCWWVFNMEKKYWKLREWLLPPWYISVQVMVTGCLLARIGSCIVSAMVFLHCCPVYNHEYHQTYAMFASSALEFLIVMTTFVSGTVFAKMSEDRQWMPRPDMNFLSWGYGFFIISGLMAMAAGACFYIEAKRTYEGLLKKETEYENVLKEQQSTMGSGYGQAFPMHSMDYNYQASLSSGQKPRSDYSGGGYAPSQGSGYAPSKHSTEYSGYQTKPSYA